MVLNEGHLIRVLREFARLIHLDWIHRSLHLAPPVRRKVTAPTPQGARLALGGLHYAYSRAA